MPFQYFSRISIEQPRSDAILLGFTHGTKLKAPEYSLSGAAAKKVLPDIQPEAARHAAATQSHPGAVAVLQVHVHPRPLIGSYLAVHEMLYGGPRAAGIAAAVRICVTPGVDGYALSIFELEEEALPRAVVLRWGEGRGRRWW